MTITTRKAKKKKAQAATIHKQIGARIREKREAANLKQKDLGVAIGVSEGQVSRYEKGETKITNATLIAIAHKLKCPVADLFGEALA